MIMTAETGDRLWKVLRPLGWVVIALLLLAPAVAMQFTSEVQWTPSDFVFAGVVLIGAGAICELFAARVRSPVARIAFSLFMVLVVGGVWAWAVAGP
jgi:hypothetical protein